MQRKLISGILFSVLLLFTLASVSAYDSYHSNYQVYTFNPNPTPRYYEPYTETTNYQSTSVNKNDYTTSTQTNVKTTTTTYDYYGKSTDTYVYSSTEDYNNNPVYYTHINPVVSSKPASYVTTYYAPNGDNFKVKYTGFKTIPSPMKVYHIDPRTSGQRDYYGYDSMGKDSSDWRNKQVYNYVQYGPDQYPNPYYYQPRVDSSGNYYNWAY